MAIATMTAAADARPGPARAATTYASARRRSARAIPAMPVTIARSTGPGCGRAGASRTAAKPTRTSREAEHARRHQLGRRDEHADARGQADPSMKVATFDLAGNDVGIHEGGRQPRLAVGLGACEDKRLDDRPTQGRTQARMAATTKPTEQIDVIGQPTRSRARRWRRGRAGDREGKVARCGVIAAAAMRAARLYAAPA